MIQMNQRIDFDKNFELKSLSEMKSDSMTLPEKIVQLSSHWEKYTREIDLVSASLVNILHRSADVLSVVIAFDEFMPARSGVLNVIKKYRNINFELSLKSNLAKNKDEEMVRRATTTQTKSFFDAYRIETDNENSSQSSNSSIQSDSIQSDRSNSNSTNSNKSEKEKTPISLALMRKKTKRTNLKSL